MSRIQPLDAPYPNDVSATFERLMPPGMDPLRLFRTVAHNPRVLQRMHRGGLLDAGSLSVRQRELTILRTCALCGAEYEWGVHVAIFGGQAGLDETAWRATWERPSSSTWSDDELLIFELCEALHRNSHVDDDLFARLRRCFDEAQVIELVMLVGLYHAVSFIVNVTGVERETWAPRP